MKRGPFLLDTGFLVALVNSQDPAHVACSEAWSNVQGPFISTEGVLVETAWLVRKEPGALNRALAIVQGVGTRIFAPMPWRYVVALEKMHRYRDVPMDLVDALLVALSDELGVLDVLTVDRRGFRAYRDARNRPFKLLP